MQLWLFLAGVLLLQEPFSATFVILQAVQAHYSLILIHLLWLILTVAETYLGYALGIVIQKHFTSSKFEIWIETWTRKIRDLVGTNGERVALIFFTILTLPFFTGFVSSWLSISLWNIILFSVLGSLVWYLQVLLSVYGADQFSSSFQTTVISVIVISTLLAVPFMIWRRKQARKH